MSSNNPGNYFSYIIAILLPPAALLTKPGIDRGTLSLNVLLTLLGWIPGVLHAWYVLSEPTGRYARGGAGAYVVTKESGSGSGRHKRSGSGDRRHRQHHHHHGHEGRHSGGRSRRGSGADVYVPVEKGRDGTVYRRA